MLQVSVHRTSRWLIFAFLHPISSDVQSVILSRWRGILFNLLNYDFPPILLVGCAVSAQLLILSLSVFDFCHLFLICLSPNFLKDFLPSIKDKETYRERDSVLSARSLSLYAQLPFLYCYMSFMIISLCLSYNNNNRSNNNNKTNSVFSDYTLSSILMKSQHCTDFSAYCLLDVTFHLYTFSLILLFHNFRWHFFVIWAGFFSIVTIIFMCIT